MSHHPHTEIEGKTHSDFNVKFYGVEKAFDSKFDNVSSVNCLKKYSI